MHACACVGVQYKIYLISISTLNAGAGACIRFVCVCMCVFVLEVCHNGNQMNLAAFFLENLVPRWAVQLHFCHTRQRLRSPVGAAPTSVMSD